MAANYRDAIASIESGGNYGEVGPPADANGSRAYGRYQVMDYNVGPWTEQVLGRRMTPQEFLADQAAQDAVFDGIFGGYVERYGPQGAAQAWFGGPGSVGSGGGAQGVLGTSRAAYGKRFKQALGYAPTPPAPVGAAGAVQQMGTNQPAAGTMPAAQPEQYRFFNRIRQFLDGRRENNPVTDWVQQRGQEQGRRTPIADWLQQRREGGHPFWERIQERRQARGQETPFLDWWLGGGEGAPEGA